MLKSKFFGRIILVLNRHKWSLLDFFQAPYCSLRLQHALRPITVDINFNGIALIQVNIRSLTSERDTFTTMKFLIAWYWYTIYWYSVYRSE